MADATRRVSVRLSLDDAARVKAGLREVGETGQRSLDQIKGGAERASRSLELLDVATLGGGARGLIMQGVIQYTGAANAPATVLTLGDGGTTRNGEKLYLNLQVTRQIQSDWASEADTGILARNLDSSILDIRLVSGFTIGVRTLGDGRGFEDTTLILGRILNNRYGLDAHCATATAWNTSIRYYGGHFACATGINPTLDRFGVRFSRQAGAYKSPFENHRWATRRSSSAPMATWIIASDTSRRFS